MVILVENDREFAVTGARSAADAFISSAAAGVFMDQVGAPDHIIEDVTSVIRNASVPFDATIKLVGRRTAHVSIVNVRKVEIPFVIEG